ncbi:MAG: hypothetical protein H7240_09165 [Glaciimonas sp.]|nr:hypothetical protein [Glaciimonas sp.]
MVLLTFHRKDGFCINGIKLSDSSVHTLIGVVVIRTGNQITVALNDESHTIFSIAMVRRNLPKGLSGISGATTPYIFFFLVITTYLSAIAGSLLRLSGNIGA